MSARSSDSQAVNETLFCVANHIHWQLKNKLVYILADGSDEIVELNATASLVWQLLAKEPQTIHQLALLLHKQFAVEYETAVSDVEHLVNSLQREKLVVKKALK